MNRLFKNTILGVSYALAVSACSDQSEQITSIDYERLFSPINMKSEIKNDTVSDVTWTSVTGASSYDVEIYEEDANMAFSGTPLKVSSVTAAEALFTGLAWDTDYSVRVKAKGENITESKWTALTFKTNHERLLTIADDTEPREVTLQWPIGQTATAIIITPGDITHNITPEELATGTVRITGLTGKTAYTATLKNGKKTRGLVTWTTPIDPLSGATLVTPQDDLAAVLTAASDGDIIALQEGTYNIATINVTKSVIIAGVSAKRKPVLQGTIIKLDNNAGVELKNLILDGTGSTGDQTIVYAAGDNFGALAIDGCEIKNYTKGALYVNYKTKIKSISITNCLYHEIECNGGDMFDFRNGLAETFKFSNNTVYNSALARDFFRMDAPGSTNYPDSKSVITIENNTFYKVINGATRRMLYIRLGNQEIHFNKNILAGTLGYYSNQPSTTITEMKDNNYFNAPNFTASTQVSAKNDTGVYTSLDPGFANADAGNFKVSNATLITKIVGDARWLK
jgi:hypothetical protein